jgi:AraC-like DNA-binding protein
MDILSDILSKLRLSGTLYFRTSFTSPWSVRVPSYKSVLRFHFAHVGRCLCRIEGVDNPVPLDQGDLIIITRGASHTLYCDPSTEDSAVTLDRVIEESGFTGHGTLVYGEFGTDHETQLVCGHFAFDERARHPLVDALPPYIHLRNYGEAAGAFMENTLKVIGSEAGRDRLGSDLIALKLSEILFAQALRAYVESAGVDRPVLAGFADRRLAAALKAIHDEPAHPWTLGRLARLAGMSRTSFAVRFSEAMSMTPLAYITQWRMQLARDALENSDASIADIAENVGYQSEAAFSRVFKKHIHITPAAYRRSVRDLAA